MLDKDLVVHVVVVVVVVVERRSVLVSIVQEVVLFDVDTHLLQFVVLEGLETAKVILKTIVYWRKV